MSDSRATGERDADGVDLLAHCPACGYSLRGLPVVHACGECGLSFDRRWKVFGGWVRANEALQGQSPLLRIFYVLGGICCLSSILAYALASLRSSRLYLGLPLLGLFGVLVVVGFLYFCDPRRLMRSKFVAVGEEGLVVYRSAEDVECVAWRDVKGVDVKHSAGGFIIRTEDHICRTGLSGQDGCEAGACYAYVMNHIVCRQALERRQRRASS